MPQPVIDATVGGASANSYATPAWAGAYFADKLESERWVAFPEEDRARALIAATARVEEESPFWDVPYDTWTPQALYFPRRCDRDPSGVLVVPDRVKIACAELALHLLQQRAAPELVDRLALQAQGVETVQVGEVQERFRGEGTDLPLKVQRLLSPFIRRAVRIVTESCAPRRHWTDGWVAL